MSNIQIDRAAFEAHWTHVRGEKKASRELVRHPLQPQVYVEDSANRHWVTWQAAVQSQATQAASQDAIDAKRYRWLPIETAPKDGTLIIVQGDNHGDEELGQHHCIARWFNGAWMEASDWNATSYLKHLTKWAPLPASKEQP